MRPRIWKGHPSTLLRRTPVEGLFTERKSRNDLWTNYVQTKNIELRLKTLKLLTIYDVPYWYTFTTSRNNNTSEILRVHPSILPGPVRPDPLRSFFEGRKEGRGTVVRVPM